MTYGGKRVVVTGGHGFIGSNLVIRLVEEGAQVTLIDSLVPGCGGNRHNIAPVRDRVTVIEADIEDTRRLCAVLAKSEIIFNLAGEISHIHSMQFPERDLQINTVAQLRFLLACKEAARGVRIVYAGTRQVYGVPKYLPVDEAHPIQPVDYNGVHKYAATMYHQMLTRSGDIDGRILRLTNVYGPRMALNVECQGFLSTYLRKLILKEPLQIFGDGRQFRDPIYVDDAVEAFLQAGEADSPAHRTWNVGGPEALSLAEIAAIGSRLADTPEPEFTEFPSDRRRIDIGSYRTNGDRIARDLGWRPRIRFVEGLRRTLEYYGRELPKYLEPGKAAACTMPEHRHQHRLEYVKVG